MTIEQGDIVNSEIFEYEDEWKCNIKVSMIIRHHFSGIEPLS